MADVRNVDSAVRTVVAYAKPEGVIVGKSTVPMGTAQRLAAAATLSRSRMESGTPAQGKGPPRHTVSGSPRRGRHARIRREGIT